MVSPRWRIIHRTNRRPVFKPALKWIAQMSKKPSFAIFETSSRAKIYRIPLEAFPNFWAYIYLVLKDDYRVLIDCGSGTGTSHEDLLNGLEHAKLQPSDLTHIFLTHAHIDH